MKVWSQRADGSMDLGAMRCDRCRRTVSAYRPEDDANEMQEFLHIEINAGPTAVHFTAGDTLVADLCEKCAHQLLVPSLRRVASVSGEVVLPFLDLDGLGLDLMLDELDEKSSNDQPRALGSRHRTN